MPQLSDYIYYEEPAGVIYCGDCFEILPLLPEYQTVIIDPVWPNATPNLKGHEDPYGLLENALGLLSPEVKRVIVHLGVDSDPRILTAVPRRFPFFRVANLRYGLPIYKGRVLYDRDMAYLFGKPPASRNGNHVIPGDCIEGKAGKESGHPCPRKLKHVQWLVHRFSDPGDTILDMFAGSCTTFLAAKELGRTSIAIEIEERFCEMGKQRLAQEVLL